ncbi:protoporphyrinogen oxidase [Crateriforma conspicua]|uniref:Coproporphyrinogen III oxidase n=1 Tax=Crateriforma conspicua TaxID=2527996 RepID=A0A5C5YBA6_9PLAN|nr:protoporphyrinogen oxidase [Crateriforma conspicua]TWT71691.1 Protoporphyrinogen oxidase [Crateriforma conspicua]
MIRQTRIAVIGGGLAGLATSAWLRLDAPEIEVCLFESSDCLGGVIGTSTLEHPDLGTIHLDRGADMLATEPSSALDLIDRLDASDRLIHPKSAGRGAMIVHQGRLRSIPEGFVLMRPTRLRSMVTTPLLSPQGKLRLLAEPCIGEPDSEDDESVASFVRRRFGDELLQRIVQPLVAGIYTADVERLSMRATMAPIHAMVRRHGSLTAATLRRRFGGRDGVEATSSGARYEKFRAFRFGMQGLIDLLAESLPPTSVRTNAAVNRIGRNERGGFDLALADASVQSFDQVVVATPASRTANLIADLAPAASDQLASIISASAGIVVMVVRREDMPGLPPTFGLVVPAIENRRILAVSFASEKFAGRCPPDHVIVRVFVGGMLQSDLLQRDDADLVQLATDELRDLVGLSGAPVHQTVVRWNKAMPQYEIGHLDRVATIDADIARIPGLHLCSNALRGVGIAPLIGQAGQVAKAVIDQAASTATACC